MATSIPIPVNAIVKRILDSTLEDLQNATGGLIPSELMPPATFINALLSNERADTLKTCNYLHS
jgi:hypothetical protein